MSENPVDDFLAQLEAAARSASTVEDAYRQDAMEQIRKLEQARAFAFRRLNLVRTIMSSMTGAKDQADAMAQATEAFLRELNWNGASESQRQVVERFMPMITIVWQLSSGIEVKDGIARLSSELAAFETWFAENRTASFLSLMDGEVLELPLVEV
jgi:hypothetical protein